MKRKKKVITHLQSFNSKLIIEMNTTKKQLEVCKQKKLENEQTFRLKIKKERENVLRAVFALTAASDEMFQVMTQLKIMENGADSNSTILHSLLLHSNLKISELEHFKSVSIKTRGKIITKEASSIDRKCSDNQLRSQISVLHSMVHTLLCELNLFNESLKSKEVKILSLERKIAEGRKNVNDLVFTLNLMSEELAKAHNSG